MTAFYNDIKISSSMREIHVFRRRLYNHPGPSLNNGPCSRADFINRRIKNYYTNKSDQRYICLTRKDVFFFKFRNGYEVHKLIQTY